MRYKVNEIYYSIQAEGFYAGTPAIFIRLSGCNLQCPWCDTKYHNEGTFYTKNELEEEVDKLTKGNKDIIIVFTGGEPTLQLKDEEELLKGYYRTIETNGLLPAPKWFNWITCSPKTDIKFSTIPNEIKIVYEENRQDYIKSLLKYNTKLYIQPLEKDNKMNIKETIDFIKDNPKFKLSLQIHKMIGVR